MTQKFSFFIVIFVVIAGFFVFNSDIASANQRRLNVIISGNGRVRGGVNCTSDCHRDFNHNLPVNLEAVANANHRFVGWRGVCTGDSPTCSITMSHNAEVAAIFTLIRRVRECNNGPNENNSGGCGTACMTLCEDSSFYINASGRIACRREAERTSYWTRYEAVRETYLDIPQENGFWASDEITIVTTRRMHAVCSLADKLTPNNLPRLRAGNCVCGEGEVGGIYKVCCASEGTGWREVDAVRSPTQDNFLPPEGQCPPNTRVAWTEGGTTNLVAEWRGGQLMCPGPEMSLEVTVTDGGGVRSTTPGGGINCPGDCDQSFNTTTTVGLTATANANHRFVRWEGACTHNTPNCEVTISPSNANRRVTAVFEPLAGNLLRVNITGSGRVGGTGITCPTDCTESFPAGNNITATLTPTANANYRFLRWDGCTSVSNNICSVRMDRSHTVTAVFEPQAMSRYWFCANNECRQTADQYATAALCEAAVLRSWRIRTTCHLDRASCDALCLRTPVLPVIPVVPPPICFSGPTAVVTSLRAEGEQEATDCLPFHPNRDNPSPSIRETNIGWEGIAINTCRDIIGIPGTPNIQDVSCETTSPNWSARGTGSGRIMGTVENLRPTRTQYYTMECTRATHVCSGSQVFSSGSTAANNAACEKDCERLSQLPGVESCVCSRGECIERYTNNCEIWNMCSYSCTRCDSSPTPTCWETTCWEPCPPCIQHHCRRWAADQDVRSRAICPSSHFASQQIRFIQPPHIGTGDFRIDSPRPKPQILLHQFINLVWNVTKPDSGVPTTLRCTPSVARGDGRGWTGVLDSLLPSGRVNQLSPSRTTVYQLTCRNRDVPDSRRCYHDSNTRDLEVKVFTPDLKEVPAWGDGFMRILGMIGWR